MNVLAFDFGGTSVKYGIWLEDKMTYDKSFPTPSSWEELKFILMTVREEFFNKFELDGVAFSFPGAVDSAGGFIYGLSAIPYIHNFPIKAELKQLFKLPVSIENDANCAALAEVWQGAAVGIENTLFVVIGTGVGGAIISNGKLQHGKHLYGGEFGFMLLDGEHTLSELGTAVRMADRYCTRLGVSSDSYSGKEVFELADKQDPIAIEEVEIFYKAITRGLFNLQLCFDPEVIVIGGGLSTNANIINTMQEKLDELMVELKVTEFKAQLRPCHFRNGANLIGAVKNFLDKYSDYKVN